MADPTHDAATIPVVAILGTDALLAARPATPVQLAHACLSAGYTEVYPASWGDELIAARSLEVVRARGREPAILCACPFVAERLLKVGDELAPFIVPFVSPPVAAALYLRAIYGEDGVHITYIGACPSGADPAIDLQLTPGDLLIALRDRGIELSQQPRVFNAIIPPDRRRYYSLPGGAPSSEWLEREGGGRRLTVLDGDDPTADLAQQLIAEGPVLIDPAPCMGCVCSGASASASVAAMRQLVATIEPPHATSSVVDTSIALELALDSPYALVRVDEGGEPRGETAVETEVDAHPEAHDGTLREMWVQERDEGGEEYVDLDIAPADDLGDETLGERIELAVEMTEAQVEIRKEQGVADLGDLRRHELVPWEEDLPSWNGDTVAPAEQDERAEQEPADDTPQPLPGPTGEADAPAAGEATVESTGSQAPLPASENGQRHTPRPRRVTPASVRRLALHTPVVRTEEGRTLPRAYVVQRRAVTTEAGATEIVESTVVATSVADEQETTERELPLDTSIEPATLTVEVADDAERPAAATDAATEDEPEPVAEAPVDATVQAEPVTAAATEVPPAEELSVGQPSLEEPSIEEPSIEEPSIEEPSIQEPSIEEPPPPRPAAPSFRSVVVPIPSDRPRPIPPPPLKDRSPLAWALLGIAAIALSVVVIRMLSSEQEAQRADRDTTTTPPVAQPLPATGTADSVTVTSDSASISAAPVSSDTTLADTGAARDSAIRDSVARDSVAARDSVGVAGTLPDTSVRRADSAAVPRRPDMAPGASRRRMMGSRRGVTPRQVPPLTPDQRRRRFDSLARIVDSLVPVSPPARPPR